MSLGAAQVLAWAGGWQIVRQPGADLSALLIGRPVDQVAALLPRLFNLCRRAQSAAACLSLGLPVAGDTGDEVVQDHLARLFVTLRRAFGLAPLRPDPAALTALPRRLVDLDGWLAAPGPLAELGRAVEGSFAPGVGVVPALPDPRGAEAGAFENSPAGRQRAHPLLRALEARQGRGPLWRFLGLVADLAAAPALAAPQRLADGTALVQAARGVYALRLEQAGGRVTGVLRRTPTDHQLAPGGALALALARVPVDRDDLARRLIALHDPCVPVTVGQVQHA
jgi:hypothetical protein